MSVQGPRSTSQKAFVDEFRAGVTACLRSWSALKHAVESGWGGIDSVQKADDLRQNIIHMMENGQIVDPLDLEDSLAIFMEEEFSLQLEDASEKQVSECIWNMYEQCRRGDSTLVEQVIQGAENAAIIAQAFPSQVQSNEHDDDDDEDMMDAHDTPADSVAAVYEHSEYAAQSIFGKPKSELPVKEQCVRQLGEAGKVADAPMDADEEGFTQIAKGRRKART